MANNQKLYRNYYLPGASVEFHRFYQAGNYAAFSYNFDQHSPTMYNLISIVNTSDPLAVQRGNAQLSQMKRHRIMGQYYHIAHGVNHHNFVVTGTLWQDKVASQTSYNKQTGQTIYTSTNVNGNYDLNIYIKNELHLGCQRTTSFTNDLTFYIAKNADYVQQPTDPTPYKSSVFSRLVKEEFAFGLTMLKQRVRLSLGGYFHYNNMRSKREGFQTMNSWDYGFKTVVNAYLPWAVQLSTDLRSVSRRGYAYAPMNDDQYIWNARLTKAFGERLQVQLEVNDILNQRKNTYYLINGQMRLEEIYNNMRRYGMIHLIWSFGKKKVQNHAHY